MGWGGKLFLGALGAAMGGPVGAAVGAGIGHVLFDDDEGAAGAVPASRLEVQDFEFVFGLAASRGPVARFMVSAVEPEGRITPGSTAAIHVLSSGQYLKSADAEFADSDGDVVAVSYFLCDSETSKYEAFVDIPYSALGANAVDEIRMTICDGQGELLFHSSVGVEFPSAYERDRTNIMAVLADASIAMVRRDGRLEREEVTAIRGYMEQAFELDDGGREVLRGYLKRADRVLSSVDDIAMRTRMCLADDLFPEFISFLHVIAAADGSVDRTELEFIEEFAAALGTDPKAEAGDYGESSVDYERALATLELEHGATKDEIRRAYRRLVAEYHPDKVQSLPEGFRAYATEKTQEINAAYDLLKRHR
jgi:DnaJ like chaperone protein